MPESSGDEEEEGRKKVVEQKKKAIESSEESEEESEEEVEQKKAAEVKGPVKKTQPEEEESEEESEEEESEEYEEETNKRDLDKKLAVSQSMKGNDTKAKLEESNTKNENEEEEESSEEEDENEPIVNVKSEDAAKQEEAKQLKIPEPAVEPKEEMTSLRVVRETAFVGSTGKLDQSEDPEEKEIQPKKVTFLDDEKVELPLYGEIVAGSPVKMIKLAHWMTTCGKMEVPSTQEVVQKEETVEQMTIPSEMSAQVMIDEGQNVIPQKDKTDQEIVQLSSESPSVLTQQEPVDGRKSPKIPPKTYMWEDVRRSKVKGGYPWTHLYKGSMDEDTWRSLMEHEYEPITPMGDTRRSRSPMVVCQEPSPKEEEVRERKFIRIPDSDQIIIPLHGSSDEEYNPDRYLDKGLLGQEQVSLKPAFRPSPSPAPPSPREAEANISQRLRSTATNLGSKIRKISLPDKSKIRLPEKPKFLTEKPKFLTEKPKFLTEKPKFLTEKPKFLTEKPKFLTEKPKFLTERPKFKMPDASRFKIDRSKMHMPRIKFPKKRGAAEERRQQAHVSTVTSEFGSEKNIFETIKAKTYPRFLKKKNKERSKRSQQVKQFDWESVPSTPQSKRNEEWVERYKGRGGDNVEEKVQSSDWAGETFHQRYTKREGKRAGSSSSLNSDREQASSGSSTQRHRAGVIEEIDSDEFFVRVKGISREDVDVSRYLSTEIREAFRSPQNALASLDLEDDNELVKAPKEYPRQECGTFPMRPSRGKGPGREGGEKPPRRFKSKNRDKECSSLGSLEGAMAGAAMAGGAMAGGATREEHVPPLPPKRRKSAKDIRMEDQSLPVIPTKITSQDEEITKVVYDIPVAPVRKTRSQGTSLGDEDRTSRGAESLRSELHDDRLEDHEFQQEEEEPVSRGTVKYQEEMIHGYDLVEDLPPQRPARSSSREKAAYATVTKPKPDRPPPPKRQFQRQIHTWKNQGVNIFWTYPRRAIKSLNRPMRYPKRPFRNYSTIAGPTRPPRRSKVFREPVYADEGMDDVPYIDDGDLTRDVKLTLDGSERMKGRPLPPPPRPPRKTKDFDTLEKQSYTTEEMNILNDLDSKEIELSVETDGGISETIAATLLTSYEEDVKSKYSPAPKRPSRKSSYSSYKENLPSSRTTEISQQTSFDVTEITVSVQTDPLPEGFIVEDTESSKVEPDDEPSIEKYLEKYGNEIKMLGRQVTKTVGEKSPVIERKANVEQSNSVTEINNESQPERKLDVEKKLEKKENKVVNKEIPYVEERKLEEQKEKSKIELTSSDRLHLSTLDVDNLNVSSLKASQILVSDLTGQSLQVAELTSRGGNLVVSGVEFPPEFIQSIASEIQARVESRGAKAESRGASPQPSPQPQKKTLMAAPPPIVVQATAETVSPPTPQTSSQADTIPRPRTTRSRGQKSPSRIIDDSEDELASTMPSRVESQQKKPSDPEGKQKKRDPPSPGRSVSSESPQPSATRLLIQLINIWRGYMLEGFFTCYNTVNNFFPEGDKRRDAQTAACILFILILGLIAMGFGVDNTVHHHHWDFVPPRK